MSRRHPPATGWHLHPQLAEDTHPIAAFELSELRLMDDANHPWLILVPRLEGATEWIDLDVRQQATLSHEISIASRVLQREFRPHKLNVAALGNLVPQLHIHVIARFEHDIAWPRPVWGTASAKRYSAEELAGRVGQLQTALAAVAAP